MVLELLLSEEFDMVLGWLAGGELRSQLARLENVAGRSVPTEKSGGVEDLESVDDGHAVVFLGSPKMLAHSEKLKFVVIITEVRS